MRKKALSPASRRAVATQAVSAGMCTRRAACRFLRVARSTYSYRGRMLTILDEHTRECHVLRVDRALRSQDVLEWLQKAMEEQGAPQYIRSDNGSEFIARIVQRWLKEQQIKTIYIEPGSPWQNGFVESFHGRFRDECLNREQLWTLTEARVVVEDFRRDYNQERPHSRLGYASPAEYAARICPSPAPVGLRPPSTRDGQTEKKTTTSKQCLD